MLNTENLEVKWASVLESEDAPAFQSSYRKSVTARLLENQEEALQEERAQAGFLNEGTTTGNIDKWAPILISLVRRATPNLVAYDIAGVQPMILPTGQIYAMRAQHQNFAGANTGEALGVDEPNKDFSGPLTTAQGEALSGNAGIDSAIPASTTTGDFDRFNTGDAPDGQDGGFGQMGVTIDRTTVTAKTRALKAEFTMEFAQDMKKAHGLDAESELANILSTEILAEQNREIIHTVNTKAKSGAQTTTVAGTFDLDLDADGRWAKEKFASLVFQLELEANAIAKATRRSKGNVVLCSSNVASALSAAGYLDFQLGSKQALNVDDTGNLFAGVLNGRLKVYVDPYAANDYATVVFRGTSAYDAGIFYCPYVPLTMVRATGEQTFQPKIGFKTRYGLVANPFAGGAAGSELGTDGQNQYFSRFLVTKINGAQA